MAAAALIGCCNSVIDQPVHGRTCSSVILEGRVRKWERKWQPLLKGAKTDEIRGVSFLTVVKLPGLAIEVMAVRLGKPEVITTGASNMSTRERVPLMLCALQLRSCGGCHRTRRVSSRPDLGTPICGRSVAGRA